LQLWALGRAANTISTIIEDVVSASDVRISSQPADRPSPRPLTVPEIHEYAQLYAQAALNAVEGAGFDGVEIYGANGYLVDQFIQDTSNRRTDDYGGSPEKRSRFALEVVEAVAKAVGPERTAIRLSPWSHFQESRMADPVPTYTYLLTQLRERVPNLSYIHLVEPRADGVSSVQDVPEGESNDFARRIWAPRPIITAGGYTPESGLASAEKGENELIAYGRSYIANVSISFVIFIVKLMLL
jgi:NADPH2 dehydrogenase